MVANYTLPSSSNQTIIDLMHYDNSITGGFFGIVILIIVFFIFFLSLIRSGVEKAFASSSIITAISSYFLAGMSLLDPALAVIPTIMVIVSLFVFKQSET